MEPGQQVAIWLHDKAAKLFLGLDENHPAGRWAVIGHILDITSPSIGVWVDVMYVDERRPIPDGKTKVIRYSVEPGQCLIRWDSVIAAQNLKA